MTYWLAFKSYLRGSHKIRLLLTTLTLLVVADGLISRFLVSQKLGQEGNPFLQSWIGADHFLIIKSAGAILAAFILWDIHKKFPKISFLATVLFVTAYTAIVFWNLGIYLVGQA